MRPPSRASKKKRIGPETVFLDLGRSLNAAKTTEEAALVVLEAADKLFGWDTCGFDILAKEGETFSRAVYRHKGKSVQHQSSSARSNSESPGQLLAPRVVPVLNINRQGNSMVSSMRVPVKFRNQIIGLISVDTRKSKPYSREDLRLLEALADYCAGALERLESESEVSRLNGELGQLVDDLRKLNSELERRVQERTSQLEAVNKELESFAYSISHDLRAPLRSIRGFSEVLLERYSDRLDERGQEFLRRSCQSSLQIDALINDLLKLSRLSRVELIRQTLSLSSVVEAIGCQLQREEPNRLVEFVIVPGLHANADEHLVRVALENLLRNALKFTRNQPRARIEFGRSNESPPTFFVKDNGVGFEMAYADKLFGVFQRLHSPVDFPGSGVGLATVKRIIHRHGGRTWAQGAAGQGATFFFTLP